MTQRESGGAQRVAVDLSHEMTRLGHPSAVLFLFRRTDAFDGEGTDLVHAEPRALVERLTVPLRLLRQLRRDRPDVVFFHTKFAVVLGAPIARLAGIRRVVAVHHSPLETYGALRLVDLLLGSVGAYSRVVGVAPTVASSWSSYPRQYRKRAKVVINGVSRLVGGAFRAPVEPGHLRVISVGRLALEKNHQVLVRAVHRLPNVSLTVAGDGPLRSQLAQVALDLGVSSRIRFLGEVDRAGLAELYSNADVFAHPSTSEGMSIALMEALQVGLPVLASDIAPNRAVAGEAALYFANDSCEDAVRKLACLMNEHVRNDLVAKSVLQGRRFSAAAMACKYLREVGAVSPETDCEGQDARI